jgi:iron complex transport system substrate-binding protein
MNNRKLLAIVISLLLLFTISACNINSGSDSDENVDLNSKVQYPMTLKDSYGREVTLDKEPERVISVAPNITETIFAMGKQDKLVGRTDYCDYPEAVSDIESVGNIDQPGVEKIVELKPDLVIASSIFQKEVLEKLEDLNIKVAVLQGEESFEGAYDVIGKIGILLNSKDEARKIINDMKEKVELVKNSVKELDKPSVYYVIGYGEFGDYTAGRDTFIAHIIEMAGGINVADDVDGWKYNIESLLEKDPDMLICSRYFDSKQGIMNTAGYKELTAVKNGRVFEIDNNMLDRQGPRLADGLVDMAKIIQPEAFGETER